MSLRVLLAGLLVLPLLPALGVCSPEPEAPPSSGPGKIQQPSVQSALVGRTWQLVEIVSMNDRVDAPDDRSLYTMTLKADGAVQIRGDCNHGTGSWTSVAPGKLWFGKIAATHAMCRPDSLHDRYMAQFPWVSSYVMQEGHLFLATMADGSIIELEPAQLALAATVLGEEVRTGDAVSLSAIAVLTLTSPGLAETQQSDTFPPAEIRADEGGPQVVRGEWTDTSGIVPEHYVEPVAALMNVSRYAFGEVSAWVPVDEQVLGRLTSARTTPPVSYQIRAPIRIDGKSVDVDNDGEADAGVQIYGLFVGSNLTGDSYLEQLDQTAYRS